jgi:hypothetical protein
MPLFQTTSGREETPRRRCNCASVPVNNGWVGSLRHSRASPLSALVLCLPAGFLDVFRLSSHLNGILLYHVLLGGHDAVALVQAGSDNSLLGLALAQQYPLNFTTKAGDSALV